MASFSDSFWLVAVAGLWGFTNPLMKRGGKGIECVKDDSKVLQILIELKFLLFNWRYMVPFVINQSGSVLYYITLASADLSLAVPVTNSLTFMFTAISASLLGEQIPGASLPQTTVYEKGGDITDWTTEGWLTALNGEQR